MPLIESYRIIGGVGESFHWGTGCVCNMSWNDPGNVHCEWKKLRLHHGRKTVNLLYLTGSNTMKLCMTSLSNYCVKL